MALRQETGSFELWLGTQQQIQAGNGAKLCAASARGNGVKWVDLRDLGEVEAMSPGLMRWVE